MGGLVRERILRGLMEWQTPLEGKRRGGGLGALGHRNLDEGVKPRDKLLPNLPLAVAIKIPFDVFSRGE